MAPLEEKKDSGDVNVVEAELMSLSSLVQIHIKKINGIQDAQAIIKEGGLFMKKWNNLVFENDAERMRLWKEFTSPYVKIEAQMLDDIHKATPYALLNGNEFSDKLMKFANFYAELVKMGIHKTPFV